MTYNLTWNVYIENPNQRVIETYNIFDHRYFYDDVVKAYNGGDDGLLFFDDFSEEVRNALRYYFWSKTQWEIVLTGWPESTNFKNAKVSVYDQIMLNYDVFINYVWDKMFEEVNNAGY